jgi:hypothetical protein
MHEQLRLAGQVVLPRPVRLPVVRRQVREHADVVAPALRVAPRQRLARDLDDRVPTPELVALLGPRQEAAPAARQPDLDPIHAVAERRRPEHVPPRRQDRRGRQSRRRRLAVGPRHADRPPRLRPRGRCGDEARVVHRLILAQVHRRLTRASGHPPRPPCPSSRRRQQRVRTPARTPPTSPSAPRTCRPGSPPPPPPRQPPKTPRTVHHQPRRAVKPQARGAVKPASWWTSPRRRVKPRPRASARPTRAAAPC